MLGCLNLRYAWLSDTYLLEYLFPSLPNRSPQKEFPLNAALVGLKTALDCRLWKAFQIRSGSMATRFA